LSFFFLYPLPLDYYLGPFDYFPKLSYSGIKSTFPEVVFLLVLLKI